MSVVAAGLPSSVRNIRWPVWVLLALAALVMLNGFTQSGLQLFSIAFVAPILFAAAVIYVAPTDRRFVWAALLLALTPITHFVAGTLPDVWFALMPGDWKNATPLLIDLGGPAREIARILGFIGLGLLGVALGGARSLLSLVIVGAGVLVGAIVAAQFLVLDLTAFPLDIVIGSVLSPVLYAGGYAFLFAAALESRRILMTLGTGLIFALIAVNYLQDAWAWLPDPELSVALLATSALNMLGWGLIIASPLRGELHGSARGTTSDL